MSRITQKCRFSITDAIVLSSLPIEFETLPEYSPDLFLALVSKQFQEAYYSV